jgi:hypothetical protein
MRVSADEDITTSVSRFGCAAQQASTFASNPAASSFVCLYRDQQE